MLRLGCCWGRVSSLLSYLSKAQLSQVDIPRENVLFHNLGAGWLWASPNTSLFWEWSSKPSLLGLCACHCFLFVVRMVILALLCLSLEEALGWKGKGSLSLSPDAGGWNCKFPPRTTLLHLLFIHSFSKSYLMSITMYQTLYRRPCTGWDVGQWNKW